MKRGTRPRANSTPGDSPGVVDSAAVAVRLRRLVVLSVCVHGERVGWCQSATTAVPQDLSAGGRPGPRLCLPGRSCVSSAAM